MLIVKKCPCENILGCQLTEPISYPVKPIFQIIQNYKTLNINENPVEEDYHI